MPSTNNAQTTTVPDPWYIQIASYKDGVKGATYSHASGVELKTFMGWTKTVILGVKSEIVLGGSVSTLLGGAIKTTVCADWNIQRGLKKDTSWGDKTEWRKGDITLRCIGKKVDFVTQDETQFMLNDRAFNSLSKTEYLNLAGHAEYKTTIKNVAQEYKENLVLLRTDAQNIINQASSLEVVGNRIEQTAKEMKLGSLDIAIEAASAVEISALKTKLTGTVAIGGVNIPNPKIAQKIAKLNVDLAANTTRRQELTTRGAQLRVRVAQQLADLP